MLLEEERKGERLKFPEEEERAAFAAAAIGERAGKPSCKTCGKVHGTVCWDERPDLAPDWLKEKRLQSTQGTKRRRLEDQPMEAHV